MVLGDSLAAEPVLATARQSFYNSVKTKSRKGVRNGGDS
jgi:hypothetical protein